MRIKIDAEGDRMHFEALLWTLGHLVRDCMIDRVPLSVNVDGDLVEDVTITIVRKQPASND